MDPQFYNKVDSFLQWLQHQNTPNKVFPYFGCPSGSAQNLTFLDLSERQK